MLVGEILVVLEKSLPILEVLSTKVILSKDDLCSGSTELANDSVSVECVRLEVIETCLDMEALEVWLS